MITQKIRLEKYDWDVTIFYAVTCYHTHRIMRELIGIGCEDGQLEKAYRQIFSCDLNMGLTYSNTEEHKSVIVIGLADSSQEYANSISHEVTHLAVHISKEYEISPYSEELCYLVGDITEKMSSVTQRLICEKCYEELCNE